MKKTRKRLINIRYLPKKLTAKDRKKQKNMLLKSRRLYKQNQYYTRRQVKSFSNKTSKHIIKARQIYNVETIGATTELSKKSGCSKTALKKIINKGAGAYYSSGSRPNQTAQSWGYARLASAITSGKSAAVDFAILEKGCKHNKPAYRMALQSRKKHRHGQRHTVRRAAF